MFYSNLYDIFVVLQDGSNLAASQRAYHPEEMSKNDTLKIGNESYDISVLPVQFIDNFFLCIFVTHLLK